MNPALLDQTCDILQELPGGNRWDPDVPTNNLDVKIPNVACSLDTAMMSSVRRQTMPGLQAVSQGAMLFINGDYGEADQRQFNERNLIRMGGPNGFVWNISVIHDIHGVSELDHYEVEVIRRVVGGAR